MRSLATPAIIAAGLAIDLLCRFVPANLPYILPFIFNAPVFFGCCFAALWYWRGRSLTPAAERPRPWRHWACLGGIGLIYAVLQTHFEYLAQHMFFLNRVQQMSIGVFGPFLIAFSWPGESFARGAPSWLRAAWLRAVWRSPWLRRPFRVLRFPPVAAVIMIAVSDIWLIPSVNFASMLDPLLYQVMNLAMIAAGLLFWFVVLDPRPKPPSRYSYLARMATGFLTMFPQIAVSSYVALSETSFYSFYDLCGRLYAGIPPLQDQLLGGIIQWIPPGMLNTAVLFVLLTALRKQDEKPAAPIPVPPGAKVYEARWTGR